MVNVYFMFVFLLSILKIVGRGSFVIENLRLYLFFIVCDFENCYLEFNLRFILYFSRKKN